MIDLSVFLSLTEKVSKDWFKMSFKWKSYNHNVIV